jgi:hypothetical protein
MYDGFLRVSMLSDDLAVLWAALFAGSFVLILLDAIVI